MLNILAPTSENKLIKYLIVYRTNIHKNIIMNINPLLPFDDSFALDNTSLEVNSLSSYKTKNAKLYLSISTIK
jgi:hypothetical protein